MDITFLVNVLCWFVEASQNIYWSAAKLFLRKLVETSGDESIIVDVHQVFIETSFSPVAYSDSG